jgi:hypothetical protein
MARWTSNNRGSVLYALTSDLCCSIRNELYSSPIASRMRPGNLTLPGFMAANNLGAGVTSFAFTRFPPGACWLLSAWF